LRYSQTKTHPLAHLIQYSNLELRKRYTQGHKLSPFLRSQAQQSIHNTTQDLRNLITLNSPIYHELLILSLETLSTTFNSSSYVDPSFVTVLQTQGWNAVSNRFNRNHSIRRSSLSHHSIAFPIYINNNHWVALCRKIIDGKTYFLYSDDLQNAKTERDVKKLLITNASNKLYPNNSTWISCKTSTSTRHSNECGPRTILALAIMMSHPRPSFTILLPYMGPNLAQTARYWMGTLLLTGLSPLLPYDQPYTRHTKLIAA